MKVISLNLILSVIITSLGIYFSIKLLSKRKVNLLSSILFILLFSILLSINIIYLDGLSKVIFSISILIVLNYIIIFKYNLGKSIYYSLIYSFLCYTIEITCSAILITIFKYSKINYEQCEYSMLLFTIINTLVIILICRIKKIQPLIKKYEKMLLNDNITKFYIIVSTVIIVLLVTNNFINYEKNIEYYINFCMLVFVIMVSVIVLYNKISKDKIEKQYKEMMDYVSRYEQIINEQGKKNHEFNNQLMVLKGYINNKKKVKEYLENIIEDYKGGKNYTIEQLSYFPDGGIKGLIYHKLSRMKDNKIRPYLYIDNSVKDIFETIFDVNTYSDITKLFGVFLDNAIDASKEAETKEIEIDMKVDDRYLIVTIGNTYSKDVDIDKIGRKGFTTKGIGHGFGLSLVKDIVGRNSKIETFNDVNNDMYKQTIIIDLK